MSELSVTELSELWLDIRRYLPTQGTLDTFIHHNTLHNFEHCRFEEACEQVARVRGVEPYMRHREFLAAIERGRISNEDLDWALQQYFSEQDISAATWTAPISRQQLYLAALNVPIEFNDEQSVAWQLRDCSQEVQALWDVVRKRCAAGVDNVFLPAGSARSFSLRQVNETLISLANAYCDRGMASWRIPTQYEASFYDFASAAMNLPSAPPSELFNSYQQRYQLSKTEWWDFVKQEVLSLSGWAAFVQRTMQLRGQGDQALLEFFLVRMRLREFYLVENNNTKAVTSMSAVAQAWHVFAIFKKLGSDAAMLESLSDTTWGELQQSIFNFGDWQRRRVLLTAYERNYWLSLTTSVVTAQRSTKDFATPTFQAVFCLDEREESIRRHLESVVPQCHTFGAAGFFGIDMVLRPLLEGDYSPRCPPAVSPSVELREVARRRHEARREISPMLKRLYHFVRKHSLRRTEHIGWSPWIMAGEGLLAIPSMMLRIGAPNLAGALRQYFIELLRRYYVLDVPMQNNLDVTSTGKAKGFTTTEMADRVASILQSIGLTDNFSQLVYIVGHGSTTTNNHFWAAYDCGACGGRRGDWNARLFARMANDPDVRKVLAERGILLPQETYFIGLLHDTTTDRFSFFDLDRFPADVRAKIKKHRRQFKLAGALNARERGRHFGWSRTVSPRRALSLAFARAHAIAEPRPEYGHGSNASCIVADRSLTRDLNLDRRCFLVSYVYQDDPTGEVLLKLLNAVMPVCGGISLEYYFSRIDNDKYGCGTKLPHNVTGIIGVMDGRSSDLRTGLPWQTVDIHEPMRLFTIICQRREVIDKVLASEPKWLPMIKNLWVRLCCFDPETRETYLFGVKGKWERLSGTSSKLGENQ